MPSDWRRGNAISEADYEHRLLLAYDIMLSYTTGEQQANQYCKACEAPIASPPKGRRRRFCSSACRQRWYRRQRQRRRAARPARDG